MLDLVHGYCDFKQRNFFSGSWKVKAVVKRVKTGCARGSREGGSCCCLITELKFVGF